MPRHRRTSFTGRRAFSVAGPMAWNSLPDSAIKLATVGGCAFPVAAAQVCNSLPEAIVSLSSHYITCILRKINSDQLSRRITVTRKFEEAL